MRMWTWGEDPSFMVDDRLKTSQILKGFFARGDSGGSSDGGRSFDGLPRSPDLKLSRRSLSLRKKSRHPLLERCEMCHDPGEKRC